MGFGQSTLRDGEANADSFSNRCRHGKCENGNGRPERVTGGDQGDRRADSGRYEVTPHTRGSVAACWSPVFGNP